VVRAVAVFTVARVVAAGALAVAKNGARKGAAVLIEGEAGGGGSSRGWCPGVSDGRAPVEQRGQRHSGEVTFMRHGGRGETGKWRGADMRPRRIFYLRTKLNSNSS
jgi:hypothetical protein